MESLILVPLTHTLFSKTNSQTDRRHPLKNQNPKSNDINFTIGTHPRYKGQPLLEVKKGTIMKEKQRHGKTNIFSIHLSYTIGNGDQPNTYEYRFLQLWMNL